MLICGKKTTRCNEVWNRIKDKVKVEQMKNLLPRKHENRNWKKAYKSQGKKTDRRLTCIPDIYWNEVLGYREVMEISKFQQIGDDNRKTETNRNDESPSFEDEREDRKIRENIRIMNIRYRHILSANFHVPTFHHVSVSFPHVWFGRQVPSHFPSER